MHWDCRIVKDQSVERFPQGLLFLDPILGNLGHPSNLVSA